MTQGDPLHPLVQAVRPIYKNSSSPTTAVPVSYIVVHHDDSSNRNIVLWDDVLQAFKDALHIRHGAVIIPFLKGSDFKNLDPPRFAAIPNVTLDVIIDSPLIETAPMLIQNHIQAATYAATKESLQQKDSTADNLPLRRHPAGDIEAAYHNYTHIDRPARGPQFFPSSTYACGSENFEDGYNLNINPISSHQSPSNSGIARSPQGNNLESKPGTNPEDPIVPSARRYLSHEIINSSQAATNSPQEYHEHRPTGNPQTSMISFKEYIEQPKDDVRDYFRKGWRCEHDDKDYAMAMEWYLKAALQDSPDAQFQIGELFLFGRGVPKNMSSAMEWYLKAADHGLASAQYKYGDLLLSDPALTSTSYDKFVATRWIHRAASQGYIPAQIKLDKMYETGEGVEKDDNKAVEWFQKAGAAHRVYHVNQNTTH
ncbi:hypothetical protein FBU30_011185 [Linnemannia zychae]|nr:hypothetical protein FBU30_011185 [Linnemannia zychae]